MLRGLVSIELGGGDRKSKTLPFYRVGLGLDAIQPQEDQAGAQSRPLVAIQKRMIPAEVEEIGGGHLRQIGKRRITADGDLRRRHGRLQQRRLAQAMRADVARKQAAAQGLVTGLADSFSEALRSF